MINICQHFYYHYILTSLSWAGEGLKNIYAEELGTVINICQNFHCYCILTSLSWAGEGLKNIHAQEVGP